MSASAETNPEAAPSTLRYAAYGMGVGGTCGAACIAAIAVLSAVYNGPMYLPLPAHPLHYELVRISMSNIQLSALTNLDVMAPLLAAFGVTAVLMGGISAIAGPRLNETATASD